MHPAATVAAAVLYWFLANAICHMHLMSQIVGDKWQHAKASDLPVGSFKPNSRKKLPAAVCCSTSTTELLFKTV
jgi:Na+-transporting methylmalonyl-CoA/oxaloacetate decarboxylase gamma subunit